MMLHIKNIITIESLPIVYKWVRKLLSSYPIILSPSLSLPFFSSLSIYIAEKGFPAKMKETFPPQHFNVDRTIKRTVQI